MKKVFLTLIILATTLTALAQATQPCVVKQYNQKKQKTPLGGVQVEVRDAGSAASDSDGRLTLSFRTLKPGDRVPFRAATKAGYELMNKTAVEQWNISRTQEPFEIVLVQSAYFAQLKGNLKQSSVDSYHQKYEQTLAELERLQKDGKLKEEEYRQKLNELEDHYDSQLKNLDAYVDQFARIDLSELSEQEQQFIELAHAGRLDEAAEAYNTLNAASKYITAVENVRRLNEDIAKLEDEKAKQQEAAKTFFAMLQRQVNTLKLAGGEENYKKAGDLLRRAALADTTNVDVVWEYAFFATNQNEFKDAEQFLSICLRNCQDNLFIKGLLLNTLGVLYYNLHDYAKAEEYLLKALENKTLLFNDYPDIFCDNLALTLGNIGNLYDALHDYSNAKKYLLKAEEFFIKSMGNMDFELNQSVLSCLAGTHNNLGNLYLALHDYVKAEDYLLKALENRIHLFALNPNAYHADLAMSQHNMGNLYSDLHDYAKAEEFYLKALENYTQLFTQNPDAYRADLANTQNSLAIMYTDIHDYAKAEDPYLKALENYTLLFAQNPNAYRENLAKIQHDLGILYSALHDYAKAEEYLLEAVENYTYLCSHSFDTCSAVLAMSQNSLGMVYHNLHDCTKAEEHYLLALNNYSDLFSKEPETYRADLSMIQNNLGLLYSDVQDYTKSEEYFIKALENRRQLFVQDPDTYRTQLITTQHDLGNLYHDIHNNTKAEEYMLIVLENYTHMFNRDPDAYRENLAETLQNLMIIYLEMGNMDKFDDMLSQALVHYEILFSSNPNFKDVVYNMRVSKGKRCLQKRQNEDAIVFLESAYELNKDKTASSLAFAYYTRAYELVQNDDYVKAMTLIDKAIALQPEDSKYSDFKKVIQQLMNE